jgi:hypothetical protein
MLAQTPPAVTRAARWVEKNPTAERRIGLAEVQRAHGFKQAGLDELRSAAAIANQERAAEIQEAICWRMLPITAGEREAFRQQVARLKSLQPTNAWAPVWELYLVVGEPNRAAILPAIQKLPAVAPERFPIAAAEKAHLALLEELGQGRVQAGVDVIAARNYEPLHALRDLDRALTREADFLQESRRDADAKQILAVRDRYRQAYRKAARHLVEKLFALHLAGQTKDRDALLAKAKTVPYLHERPRLSGLLQRMDNADAWRLLIEPLLASELTVIDQPPDLAAFQSRNLAELRIMAYQKTGTGKTIHYAGDVRLHLHGLEVACGGLTLLASDDPAAVTVTGDTDVKLRGFPGYPDGIRADRFAYHADAGTFTLGGDIRLPTPNKTIKLRTCTLTQRGELRDPRSLLDDFHTAFTIDAKLELMPKITKVYDDGELPDEVRYFLALNTLRPHLSWHAPNLPPLPDRAARDMVKEMLERDKDHMAWQEALGGEPWMLGDIGPELEAAYRESLKAWYAQYFARRGPGAVPPEVPIPSKELYFWRIRDPRHPDVARVRRLLQGIRADELSAKAQRWLTEVNRNNTVLTFDIAGAAPLGKAHSLLMDARNADGVNFKLYRVRKPEELQYAARNIGRDFLFRDHHLDDDVLRKVIEELKARQKRLRRDLARHDGDKEPAWTREQLVHAWTVRVADLKHRPSDTYRRHSRRWDDEGRWYDEPDSHYFDDECSEYSDRIDKTYRPREDNALSSWQCDRVVQIPEKVLAEAGAYVLVAESNGQAAHVPIVVEPLSLTLRRCRDGVFALVSDASGEKPLEGGEVMARGAQLGKAITDKEGVAFARVLAYGDQPIVVHHEGRYAIGGFGEIFAGLYDAPVQRGLHKLREQMKRALRGDAKEISAHRYADRHVVVAYTDRPTYRSGQEVNFKLIIRRLQPEKDAVAATTFRGAEFDARTKLVLPDLNGAVSYAVLDPKGHEVGHGSLKLSEFGTAAGKVALNTESAVGSYTFRVHIAGQPRIVPEVFAVKHYRRPNFEVLVNGVPESLQKPDKLTLNIAGQYYFGPPVAKGAVEIRLTRKDFGKSLAEERDTLDDNGKAKIEMRLPPAMEPGKYFVVCSITDDSGRTVSTTSPLTIASPAAPKGTSGLEALPRFIGLNQEWKLTSSAREIRVQQDLTDLRIPVKNGIATLKFAQPGWYHLEAGDDDAQIFVYGGKEEPLFYQPARGGRERDPPMPTPKWVNLSDFNFEERDHLSRWEDPAQHLYALFDRQNAKVGDKLRLLVYVPYEKARLLFTIEGRTILDYAVVRSQANAGPYQVVEIPIKDRYFPNVYIQGRILPGAIDPSKGEKKQDAKDKLLDRPDDDDMRDPRWCRVDVSKPAGKIDGAPLNVQIETDQATYRPGGDVRATIKVTDAVGRPQAAELSFAAVDESVYAFGEDGLDRLPGFFRMPHETRRFQAKAWRTSLGSRWSAAAKGENKDVRDLAKQLADAMKQAEAIEKMDAALPDLRGEQFAIAPLPRLGGEMPSGEVPAARLREHFQETAAWLPQLRTDETGTARASFTLPDSLTRYRLTSVALTKETDIGVGRARITAGLPLAVQVFLPRFGVEKDRVLAVAVIHNSTGQERDCRIAWQIDGATADVPGPVPEDWKLTSGQGKFTGSGRVKVPANSSDKVGLWLKLDRLGAVRVEFRADAGKDSDRELRTLGVQPLGKPAEVNANEELVFKGGAKDIAGKFHREGRVQLPAGFRASELHISVAVSDVAQALDGLDYLVDYPYGCIEQTMSRFLPAVMVKHATQHSPVRLQPEIARKLPDILDKGLTRVYGHQHTDGSWGWFEKDSKNLPMSVYVVYGLARCQATGTKVDPDVLKRGCAYLQSELRTGKPDPQLAARAWYALALAGNADVKELAAAAKQEASSSQWRPEAWCNLALACRAAGLPELGEQLWLKVNTKTGHWHGHDTETFALRLNTQVAFGAPYRECRESAARLLARRIGTRWDHTRDTSWAIEGLSNMLGYVPDVNPGRVQVTLAGKTVLDVKDNRKSPIQRVRLTANELPAQEALEIRFQSDSDELIQVAVHAIGVQRQDAVAASGKRVRLKRIIETLEGEPSRGPIKVGQVVRVRLQLDLEQPESYLLIEERRASLCEFADERIAGPAARSAVHKEFRDDRLNVFFTSLPAGRHEIIYYLRGEAPGTCTMLPGCAYPMYDDKARGETASNKLEVKGP